MPKNYRLIRVQGTSVTFPMQQSDSQDRLSPYRGNETLFARVWFFDRATVNGFNNVLTGNICTVYLGATKFSNGSATRAWSSADSVEEK